MKKHQTLKNRKKKIGCISIFFIFGVGILLIWIFFPIVDPARIGTYRRQCTLNITQISDALESYQCQNNKLYPKASGNKGLLCLSQYIYNKDVLKCPEFQKQNKTLWEKVFGTGPESEALEFKSDFIYLGGFKEDEDPIIPILFDKIGNHKNYCNVIFSDGKTEYYELPYRTYDDLLEVINKKKNYSKETLEKIKESLNKALKNNKTDNEKDFPDSASASPEI